MNTEKLQAADERYDSLGPNERASFLEAAVMEVTIAARLAYSAISHLSDNAKVRYFQGLNEVQHVLSGEMGANRDRNAALLKDRCLISRMAHAFEMYAKPSNEMPDRILRVVERVFSYTRPASVGER